MSELEGQRCCLMPAWVTLPLLALCPTQGAWATYLGKPEKILHKQAGVGVINLHHRDLVFMGHQDVVILVEDGCQVEAPAWEGQ